ncbi:MAG: cupredoxin domain-containing protein [Acidimicrobiia bacterium]
MRRLLLAVALLTLIPGVAAAGGGGDISSCSGFATGTTVSMLDSCFNGIAQFAPAGSSITVSNAGGLDHSFTAVDGSFDSGKLEPGETYELVVDEPGIYEVFCVLHGTADGQGMSGVLIVGEAVPGAVSAGRDLAAIREAVSEDNQMIVEAVERQTAAIGHLSAAQASLRAGLKEADLTGGSTDEPVAIVTVPSEPSDDSMWVLVIAGLAVGLAAAALAAVLRSTGNRSSPEPTSSLDAGFGWLNRTPPEELSARRIGDSP